MEAAMGLLSAAELSRMRAAVLASFPDTCTIRQKTITMVDGRGSASWSDRDTAVPCRLSEVGRSGLMAALAERSEGVAPWVVSIPYDQAIEAGDRVIIGDSAFEVVSMADVQSDRTCKRVYVKEAQG
jgi:hypothetical protein